jgi:hypothetical protein
MWRATFDARNLAVRFGGRGKAYLCPYPYLSPAFQRLEHQIKEFALTSHMNVRSRKNTRFAGLEMLKGRKFGRRYRGETEG